MKIKVFILFYFLFLGIGFDGFGQRLVQQYPAFIEPIITADTIILSMKEKKMLLDKCEKVNVISDTTLIGYAYYLHKIDTINVENCEVYVGLVENWIFVDSDNDKKIDFIVLRKANNANSEGYKCAMWGKNKKGNFDLLNSWYGTIVEINRKPQSISIKVIEHGCCSDFIYCEEVHQYEQQKLKMKYQICYTHVFDLIEERTVIGNIVTTNNISLYIASDSLLVEYEVEHPGIENPYRYEGEYKLGAYAIIKSNQKAQVLYYKKEQKIHWYFVVFPEKSIKRVVQGWWYGKRNIAGWIKSKTPLKIESE